VTTSGDGRFLAFGGSGKECYVLDLAELERSLARNLELALARADEHRPSPAIVAALRAWARAAERIEGP
jgi:hypothetical protein